MKVLKFGGSSVANADTIRKVAEIIRARRGASRCVVVLSAMQGTTDDLIAAGRLAETGDPAYLEIVSRISQRHSSVAEALIEDGQKGDVPGFIASTLSELKDICEGVRLVRELSPKTLDRILTIGELLSSRIISGYLENLDLANEWVDSRLLIKTDSAHGKASVDFSETDKRIRQHLEYSKNVLFILPGFIASDSDGFATTLGRGGSDYTAAIIAAAANADILEIWTDVSGMMSADPRFVRNVHKISHINYREAMELSHFGAKVIYPPTIQPVMARNIPILIKNTFDPDDRGTLIESESDASGEIIRGITSIDRISMLNLEGSGMVGIPGFSKRLFDALSRAEINVILITQSSSEHSISVAIEEGHAAKAKTVVDWEFESEIGVGKIEPLKVEHGFSILALVGDNMKLHTGVSGRMFTSLGRNGINIHAIAQGSSERNISAVIASTDVRKAVNTLHEEFFSDGKKQVNVYIAGVGNVGRRLIDQLNSQRAYLGDELRLDLRLVGIANSRRALIDPEGVESADVSESLTTAKQLTIKDFTDTIIEQNLRNSVFVDVTASPDVVREYPKLLAKSISVIACNKIAASADHRSYLEIKSLAREFGADFFFETNVGAGLPVIGTLNDLMRSGDRVNRIEAVLSGTLNFVFNNYDGSRKFAEVVRLAQDEGYTEPDPRLDLSGTDVARKILILARESGAEMEMAEIENTTFLPPSCLEGNVEDFYRELDRNEEHFKQLYDDAAGRGLKLSYIATFDRGRAAVGLQAIGGDHNFANLSGKDNAVLFYTDRYSEQPLVIKGAGAGAEVTAAGVFADIIRASRR